MVVLVVLDKKERSSLMPCIRDEPNTLRDKVKNALDLSDDAVVLVGLVDTLNHDFQVSDPCLPCDLEGLPYISVIGLVDADRSPIVGGILSRSIECEVFDAGGVSL